MNDPKPETHTEKLGDPIPKKLVLRPLSEITGIKRMDAGVLQQDLLDLNDRIQAITDQAEIDKAPLIVEHAMKTKALEAIQYKVEGE